ncbi:hypothetical protein JYU34_003869 [Plutella xylostella]|uniref:t-SNARE coiled-coil homology domain-containing protein n=1 Tax=Plutella xylostella TaxID=51655 RepID=A0ABQ7R154_PLUXY|nr:syntaxin-7 [Plutella xylostella]XP_037969095.2 syntaxin-7 [Plutella xylostella]XP_037969096.2 syntaxin-7 [Plutella xylostella]XP_037969098.2 syntaxin-7 [Plutella xylostella]KAG7311015.1 hypothetical protein JYU34_003869 [Plutella xylostella]
MDYFTSYQGAVARTAAGDNNFQRLAQNIASNIQKISQNVSSISKMVNQLHTPQDCQELRNQLRQIQNYTQTLAKDTSSMIIELMKLNVTDQTNKLRRDRLSDEYMATLNAFQATQRAAAQKTKEDVKKAKAQNINIGDPFAMNKQLIDTETIRKQEQIAMTERELRDLEQKERDVRQLESDIMDVNQIFKELGAVIHDQGAVVDSIEASVENTAFNVEAGVQDLRQAVNTKNKIRRKKVYMVIVAIIVICIIAVIICNR